MKQSVILYAMVVILGVSQYLFSGNIELAKNNHDEQILVFLKYYNHGFNAPLYYQKEQGYLVKQDDIITQLVEKIDIAIEDTKKRIQIFLGLNKLSKIRIGYECYFKLGEHQYSNKLKILLK